VSDYELLVKRIGLTGLANFVAALSPVLLLPILTKILTIQEYGIWTLIVVTASLVPALVTLGLPWAMIRFLAPTKNKDDIREGYYSIALVVLVAGFAGSFFLFLFGIATNLIGNNRTAALALLEMNATDRDLYLYDTFKGMTKPSEEDVTICGDTAHEDYLHRVKRKAPEVYPYTLKRDDKRDMSNWCYSSLEEVRKNMFSLRYPRDRIFLIQGRVEDTIPHHVPAGISILRLDTDFYESTKHELEHFFPRVSQGGVLIIDDYGHWLGQKKAVDEYIQEHRTTIFLNRVDFSCRVGVKMG